MSGETLDWLVQLRAYSDLFGLTIGCLALVFLALHWLVKKYNK